MTSVGSILRQQRESQGRAIADIAKDLCVTQRYLHAIEADDVAGIPGLFFYKNFARQYAAELGVDPSQIRMALDALSEPEDPQPRPEIRVPNRLVQATNRRHIPDVPLSWSVVGLVLVLLGCSGFYAWWKRAPEPVRAAALPSASIVSVKAAAPVIQPEQPAIETTGGVVLKLSATERTWLSISSGGKEIFAGTLQPSESKTLTGLDRATMRVGNAGGIEVLWNGKVISPLGTRGQVLTIRITPEDFEIVPPPAPKQEL
ncbi:MAG: helix-turn-helix domain-containing protein [Acidobacteriota bacterium]|nr:helix-turn-helix domain-containing protein [Acidobacteriota bacterium]